MAEETKDLDRSALQAVVAAAAEEFEADVVLVVRDGSTVKLGASEGGGLDARVILAQCLGRIHELEAETPDTAMRAFIRVASEDLGNDQLLLIVRDQGDVWIASGAGATGKVRDMLNDAIQAVGGERRRR